MSEQIESVEELDALPPRTLIAINNGDDVLTKGHDGEWRGGPYDLNGRVRVGEPDDAEGYLPVIILYRPDAPAPSDETHRALTWDDLKPYEREQGGYWLYWRGTTHGSNDNKTFIRVSRPAPSDEDRAILRDEAERAILAVWADVPSGADAGTLADNIARFQTDALAARSSQPAPAAGMPTFSTPTDSAEKCGIPEVRTAPSVNTCGCTPSSAIESGWLVDKHDHCTCGGSGLLSPAHLPECGTEPIQRLGDLPGWPAPSVSAEQVRYHQYEHFGDEERRRGPFVFVADLPRLGIEVTP